MIHKKIMGKILDERGHECPIPIVNARKALKEIAIGDKLIVKVSKQIQINNLNDLANANGYPFESRQISENEFEGIITKTSDVKSNQNVENCKCGGNSMKNIVVAIDSNKMGGGEEQLGKNLLKAFIFAITKQEQLPQAILFYNSGAYVTTEGSESLEDLTNLEKVGVKILTCGTCLDFYKLKEKLKVGQVTNMYDIVATMETADLILRP